MNRLYVLFLLPLLLLTAAFQGIEPLDENRSPDADILFPPPIYVLRGEVTIIGSANLAGMSRYFLEYRPLNADYTTADDSVAWTPATLPQPAPVIGGELGRWDTTLTPDGAYELRLVILLTDGGRELVRVSPLRIENVPSPFAPIPIAPPTPALIATPLPAQPAAVTAPASAAPEVVAIIDANVRAGDDTTYASIGALLNGQRAPVIGRSASGSGWLLIRLATGEEGWIAPSTVRVEGDLSRAPIVLPPTPTRTPTPTFTPTPNLPDATITNLRFDRSPLVQGTAFNTIVTVFNASGVQLPETQVLCTFRLPDRTAIASVSAPVFRLNPFSQADIALEVVLSSGGGSTFTAECAVDVNGVIAELNENNNFFNLTSPLTSP